MIPYSTQSISEDDIAAVVAVLRSPFLTQGPAVPAFEEAFAESHSVAHAVAVSNATAGLHIACLALGLGAGDWLWTVPNSFVASANCALYCGARVDFIDIDPVTRNIDLTQLAERLDRAERAGRLPKIVVPVDFAGLPVGIGILRRLADRYGFAILEDASHAVGALRDGIPVGSEGADIAVFSFHAVKTITTGEGGMCVTQNRDLAARMQLLRTHGITRDPGAMQTPPEGPWSYEQVGLGYNYRLTDVAAALGRSQLARLPEMAAARERHARRYDRMFAGTGLTCPPRYAGMTSAHHLYVVELPEDTDRASVFAAMRSAGIGVNVHYYPIHCQPYYRSLGFDWGQFPASEAYYRRCVSIPLFPALREDEQDFVVDTLMASLLRTSSVAAATI